MQCNTEGADGTLAGYGDVDKVASWARETAGKLTASGKISGSNGILLSK